MTSYLPHLTSQVKSFRTCVKLINSRVLKVVSCPTRFTQAIYEKPGGVRSTHPPPASVRVKTLQTIYNMSQMVTLKRPHHINVTTQIVQSFSSQPSRFDETFHAYMYMSAKTPEAKREDLMRKAPQTAAGASYFFHVK